MCIVKCYKRSDSIFVSNDLINIMLPPSSEAPKVITEGLYSHVMALVLVQEAWPLNR